MSAQMIQISSNIFKCISSQSFCKAWRLLVSYLGPGHETKLNGHFRRGTSSKWLQDVHADFTTLILRKRCVKAGEIREDQENALKKITKFTKLKILPNPNDDNDGLQCLESVVDASRDHQAIDMQWMQWQWHPILQVLQGTCYGNCQLIASLGVFPQLSAQHLLSLCHLRFTWTWVGSNAQGLRTCSNQEWCDVN